MTSTQAIFSRMTAEKDNFIAQIGGIALTIGGKEMPAQFLDSDGWQPIEGVEGLVVRPIVVPGHPESDYLQNWGPAGTYMENGEVPQSCRFTVIEGAVTWQQQWANGGKPIWLGPGMTVHLKPHEKHSYTFLEDTFSLTVVTPPFAVHTPRIP